MDGLMDGCDLVSELMVRMFGWIRVDNGWNNE
jgi:hypothetical protein